MSQGDGGTISAVICLLVGIVTGWLGLHMPSVGLLALLVALVVGALRNWRWWPPWLLIGAALPWLWIALGEQGRAGYRIEDSADGFSGGSEVLDPTIFVVVAGCLLLPGLVLLLVGRLASGAAQR